jgi:hypothetical protein
MSYNKAPKDFVKDVSYVEVTANQRGRFCEKEGFEGNTRHGNISSYNGREAS